MTPISNLFNYCIIAFDNSVVESGFKSRYEAAKWMNEHYTMDFIVEMAFKIIREEDLKYYENT